MSLEVPSALPPRLPVSTSTRFSLKNQDGIRGNEHRSWRQGGPKDAEILLLSVSEAPKELSRLGYISEEGADQRGGADGSRVPRARR